MGFSLSKIVNQITRVDSHSDDDKQKPSSSTKKSSAVEKTIADAVKVGPPVTKKPASKFDSKEVMSALEVILDRAMGAVDGAKEGKEGSSGEKKGRTQKIAQTVVGLAMEYFPETTKSVIDWAGKISSKFGFDLGKWLGVKSTEVAATSATNAGVSAASNMGSAMTKAGFSSVDDMLGNGLFTPASPQVMTPLNGASAGASSSTASGTSAATLGSIAGGIAGAYSMYEGGKLVAEANKIGGVKGRQAGSMGGLTAGLGAGMAINAVGIALGPVGWAGLLVGGLVAGGLFGSRLGDRDRWKTEGKRLGKLLEKGVEIPEELLGAMTLSRGRSKSELMNQNYPPDFKGETPEGWVNNKFVNSRDEKDLSPEDIWGYSAFFEKFGNDWLGKFNEEQRREIAQAALDSGSVRERHGTIEVKWSAELDAHVKTVTEKGDKKDR